MGKLLQFQPPQQAQLRAQTPQVSPRNPWRWAWTHTRAMLDGEAIDASYVWWFGMLYTTLVMLWLLAHISPMMRAYLASEGMWMDEPEVSA